MQKVEISYRTVLYTILTLIGIWLLYQLLGVILIWFIAFLLMTALNPLVERLQKLKLPRIGATIIVFILLLLLIITIIASLIPPLVEQTGVLVNSLSSQFSNSSFLNFKLDPNFLTSQISMLSQSVLNIFKFVTSAASNVITILSLIVLTVYLLIEWEKVPQYFKQINPDKTKQKQFGELILGLENKLGNWVRGEAILMVTIGVMSYIGLISLGIPYALPLSLLAGLLEIIPNIGPTVSAIPAVLAALTVSPALAVGVIILYIAIQQSENHIIVPLVMKQSTGLSPVITLACLMVGGALAGIEGAILAVPLFITGEVIVKNIMKWRK